MSEERKQQELASRMEQATAGESQADLDAEASRWRDAWQAWRKLFDADGELDEKTRDRLLEIPHSATYAANNLPMAEVRKAAVPHRGIVRRYLPTAAATLVVTFMLAVAMWKYLPDIEPPSDLTPPELAWDDALDNHIYYLDTRLLIAEYDRSSLGRSFDSTRWDLLHLTREIEHTSM